MAQQKPSIPKGTRDFSPAEMMRRQYIFDTIRRVFRAYGFAPLETPSMENLSTLLGKYGDEGDKLLFKILNSGDYAAGLSDEEVRSASKICEKGLRYDLTVPFARYVVQHQGELTFPFKRYQIQPVWRADRPQKGRYREFYQCDVDVIGTRSLLCEVELVEIVERVFKALGIRVALKMNNRKILFGIAEAIGHADKMMDITIAIDKLEKIGLDNVKAELLERGLGREAVNKLQPILELSGDNMQKLNQLKEVLAVSEAGMKGIEEMETVFGYVGRLGIDLTVELEKSVTAEEINAAMKAASNESFGYNEDEIVSSDIVGMRFGSLFDATQTMVNQVSDDLYEVQVVSWYDNENSYTSQMVRTIKYFAEL